LPGQPAVASANGRPPSQPTRRSEKLNSDLNKYLSDALVADRLRESERFRRSRPEADGEPDSYPSVTVRIARPVDAEAVVRLAELDGHRLPNGPLLVAEVGGSVLAARSLDNGASVAHPFRPTAELTELLELRSTHLRAASNGRFHHGGLRRWMRSLLGR
jgi:hypothetical protein